jgi:hypothetical protein
VSVVDDGGNVLGIARRDKERNAQLMAASPELAYELAGFVAWAEEHRRQTKAAGERPLIDAHRIASARKVLKAAGREVPE